MVLEERQSWFTIILDTKEPVLEIYTPSYVQYGQYVEFIVTSSEQLNPDRQSAYVLFGENRYEIALSYNEELNEYTGLFQSNAFVADSCIINVELYDTVGNKASINKLVQIISNRDLMLDYSFALANIEVETAVNEIEYNIENRAIYIENIENRSIEYEVEEMVIEINVDA